MLFFMVFKDGRAFEQSNFYAFHRKGRIRVASEEKSKVRKGFYIEEELLELVDSLLSQADVRSRNEFLNQALKFYIGYLTSEKIENYMLSTISSVMHATVKDSENRMARAMYKLAVETSKLSHVIAYSHGVDEETLLKLQGKCADEVKRINGTISFEDAYFYQRGT